MIGYRSCYRFDLIGILTSLIVLCGCASSPGMMERVNPYTDELRKSLSITDHAELPNGVWKGKLEVHTVPDVDNDGTWPYDVVVSNCNGVVRIQSVEDDGNLNKGFSVEVVPLLPGMYLLSHTTMRSPGWEESQLWTLVDARPKEWTLSISRAVLNEVSRQNDPWFTFRWVGWGVVEYSSVCADNSSSTTKFIDHES